MLQNREELNDPQTVTINEARFSVPIGEVVTRQDQLLYCMYCTVLCCMYCTVLCSMYCTVLVTRQDELRVNPFAGRLCSVFAQGKSEMMFEEFLDMMSVLSENAPTQVGHNIKGSISNL